MASNDRCRICDYTEHGGSSLLGANPRANGKVRRYGDDMLCDKCSMTIDQVRADMRPPEETDDELPEID